LTMIKFTSEIINMTIPDSTDTASIARAVTNTAL